MNTVTDASDATEERTRSIACSRFDWCAGHGTNRSPGESTVHTGAVSRVRSGPSEVSITASVFPSGAVEFEIELGDWSVSPDDLEEEISDMHSIVDKVAAFLRGPGRALQS
jgi:hypothetical protein